MNRENIEVKKSSTKRSQRIIVFALTGLLCGCTHLARSRRTIRHELDGHSQALTTAVVDALQMQPAETRDSYAALALELAHEDQRVEGLPVNPIPVGGLLGLAPTNTPPAETEEKQIAAREELERRFGRIEKL